ncbi:14 kDa phosphohistidine phosphatase-like [Gigantopelta aegis]|uniref:14 kDa phosphohistidine phosphatase-like n=1 Tax=Gigantopelta aegis TaxID=1735272 RepID=UPI001B88E003|nr:14 kDa phosphohistidine phosphatase-like [Gigantopelta aegis]
MAGASAISSAGAIRNSKLKSVEDIVIDKSGKFKYILMKVHDPDKDREFKHIVRGHSKAHFHADIYDEVSSAIEDKGLDCECVGGGRIHMEPHHKKIQVYGYSQQYGRADHSITHALLLRKYPEFNITWNNDGY